MNFILKVTESQLDIIGNALGQRPYAEVAQLIAELQKQTMDQQKPLDPPVVDEPL